MPAYEDAFYYTWKERRFPSNVTPEKSNLKDKQERERIARIFQQGLGAVVGYALPIKRALDGHAARLDVRPVVSARRRHALAHPRRFADGPAPAARFDSVGRGKGLSRGCGSRTRRSRSCRSCRRNFRIASASSAARTAPDAARRRSAASARRNSARKRSRSSRCRRTKIRLRRPAPGQSAPWIIRTALCVEPRDGRLHVFMPPVATTEDYLDLIAGIEDRRHRNWARRSSSKAKRRRAIRA